ncbi:response regulator [Ramlibacter alkalitolerans]|uniref:histidine kinase n=1 Tax=Ramlibacter alkalitolerans TaxID=2039631 RepID=A0ABS1JUI8_9BURK|nr:response regulator [Ramlibacter alkalitolerans]
MRAFAQGFVEAHRQKIFLGLAIAGTLLLGPFSVNNFIQGRITLGIATSVFMACLLANAFTIFRGGVPLVPAWVIFATSMFGLATAIRDNGLIGIFWVYPGILLFHFMLPVRQANAFNLAMVAMTVPLAWMHLGSALTARVGVTLVLVVVFANLYSRIAEAQHAKESEQREHLDALIRQLEDQNKALREAFRLREEVERIARHDLKTPLASIASIPRLLRERHPPDPVENELLGTVERAALRVLSMVNLSLDLYRMEAGTYRLRAQAVDLAAVVNTVARELHPHARSKKVRLVIELPPQPLHAKGEELLCYSTVANLLKNALEAAPEHSDVRVKLWLAPGPGGEAVGLDISNLGEVPREVRERFFEKYATHGKSGGTGLGAYSAYLMATVQQGELHMSSRHGTTTLCLRLPPWRAPLPAPTPPAEYADAAGARETPSWPQPQPQPIPALPELSVLLVDDDEYNIVVLKNLLPSPPLAVRTAVNGRDALELVRAERPDVIFLDLQMPIMGGLEAAGEIRALQQAAGQAPSFLAAFSAHDDEGTRRACIEAGFDLYLAKPASREEVLAVLRREDPSAVAQPASGPLPPPGRVWVEPGLMHLMPEFLASRRKLAETLVGAARAGERETVRVTAHKLAGSLAMYGFKDASRVSLEIEEAAHDGDLAQLRARCEALVEMISNVEPVARAV